MPEKVQEVIKMSDQQHMLDALVASNIGCDVTIQQTALTTQHLTQQVHQNESMLHLHNNQGIRSAVLSTIPTFSGGAQQVNRSGFAFITWAEWVVRLRVMFQPRMSLTESCLIFEGRRQAPGEPGAQ